MSSYLLETAAENRSGRPNPMSVLIKYRASAGTRRHPDIILITKATFTHTHGNMRGLSSARGRRGSAH